MRIGTDIIGLTINNLQRLNGNNLKTNLERLSSGLRINKGADDPSGLAISSGMKAQIRGLTVAMQNVQDGISVLRLQDGALAETHDMLMRMRDLTVRGANEATLTQEDRNRMQIELDALALEITRKANATTFNTKQVLVGEDVPGGYKILFSSERDGNLEVYIMNADGSNPVRLTDNAASDLGLQISPDGNKVLFFTNRDGNNEIYVMDSDGANATRLTNNAASDSHPSWSPDGSKIVFVSNRTGSDEIFIMDSDGSNQTQITNNGALNSFPVWSPDGNKILFQSNLSGNNDLFTIDIDGTNLTQITTNIGSDRTPSYSPDGKYIAYERNTISIHIMASDGSDPTGGVAITGNADYARWFPDGTRLTVHEGPYGTREVFIVNSDGSGYTNLTNSGGYDGGPWPGSPGPDDQLLQIGPDNGAAHRLAITFRDMRAQAIGVAGVSVLRQKAAYCGIELVDHAIETVSNYRSEIGQAHRRLELVAGDLAAAHINVSASNSRIEDTDMAAEMTDYTSNLIKEQSTTAMATHSNNLLQGAKQLIATVENAERIM